MKEVQITEHQKQALEYLKLSVMRCKQEGLPKNYVVYMVKLFLGMWSDK
jgi:hypothetical protein